jgi:solute carrier family 25 phosphate transporter 3
LLLLGSTSAVTGALLVPLLSLRSPALRSPALRYALAGGLCASLSHALAVPLDVVKTRQQVDEGDFVRKRAALKFPKELHPAYPPLKTLRGLVREEGVGVLLSGLGPTAAGYFLEGALKFGAYEALKPRLLPLLPSEFLAFVAAAAVSGVLASFLLCPVEALRIRMVSEPAAGGFLAAGRGLVRAEGARALTKGIWAMLLKQVPYTVTKQVVFDTAAKAM